VKIRIVPVAAGLAAAAGLAITGASLANAEATATPSSSAPVYGQTSPGQAPQGMPGEGGDQAPPRGNGNTDPSKPMRDDEKLLTGDVAAKVTAAAKAKEPDATIERVETDSEGVYEAHMVRKDGTRITVRLDKNYAVTSVQEGGGRGGRGPSDGQTASPEGSATSSS